MIRIGVLAPSEIAFRRFVPAVLKSEAFEYVGVSCARENEWDDIGTSSEIIPSEYEKAMRFQEVFGGEVFEGYEALITSPSIDAVYLPLPPGLHNKWGGRVINAKKHLLMEKPFTDGENNTVSLIQSANRNNVAVHENFAFVYHKQISDIIRLINENAIGEVRLIRTAFGFPYRGENDFRYHKSMGGGALLDCGGYPVRLAALLLGDSVKVISSSLCEAKGHDVDVFGSATLKNVDGLTAQVSFGMDNSYKCELEIWGSKGVITTGRVFTPTAEMNTIINVSADNSYSITVDADDQFLHSAEHFAKCITNKGFREQRYKEICLQAKLINDIRRLSE